MVVDDEPEEAVRPSKRKAPRDDNDNDDESDASSSSSSEEAARRRKRKKKAEKEKKKKKKHKKASKKSRKHNKDKAETPSKRADDDEAEAIEVPRPETSAPALEETDARDVAAFASLGPGPRATESDDESFGPEPLPDAETLTQQSRIDYGGALRPGEGAAIAQYVQKNMRIPRRGEVGWQGDEIERLESVGYVMSGSRHARMNAVRIRKENQIYSAEEKRALALITFEEKQQKEAKIMGDFREMLQARLRAQGLLATTGAGPAAGNGAAGPPDEHAPPPPPKEH